MQLLSLDSLFVPHFRELLQEGVTIGPRLADLIDLSAGSLSVWVPDATKSVKPTDLQTDIFYPAKKDKLKRDIPNFLASICSEDTSLIIIGETNRFGNELPPVQDRAAFTWLTVSSAIPDYDKFLCVCFANGRLSWETWDVFCSELKRYPSMVAVVERPSDLALELGEIVELKDLQLSNILRNTKYVLVGVFDEMSMLMWKRET